MPRNAPTQRHPDLKNAFYNQVRTRVPDAGQREAVAPARPEADTAVELALSARPDVALMDVRMPGIGGLAATAAITERSPATRVLVLTTFGLDEYLFAALRGAAGFLLKDAEPERVIDAVRVVHGGAALLDPAVTRRLIDRFADGPGPLDAARLDLLTPRETEVLRQVARGLSNAEIAAVLGVSPPTVKDHVSVLLGKLGVRDRVQTTIAAYETGLIRPGSGP
ncbi:response regulator transcription factor [Streptomyces sp. NPDC088124]|uniref:response regulator transcription factor n=1 Tax=Streptomyces sp. NPDC088124 TaxID=3154654 RepID=UPI003437C0FC